MINVILNDIIDIISGGTPKTSVDEYWKDGTVGWLSVNDFNNDNRFVYNSEKKITKLGVEKSNTKYLDKGDIIISARGTVGALAQIGNPMCFNQSCFGIRGKKNIVDTDFLYYSLKNYVRNIIKRSQGSVFNTINLASFKLMELKIPKSISYQKQIAKILSDLDAKIEVNNKINQELEALAKTLYDYWFVQFDFPDANGKPYKSSGGKMVYNEVLKREIPEGWGVTTLSNWIEHDKSGDWGKEEEQGNYTEKVSCIRGADLNGLNGKGEVKAPERFILKKNAHKILEIGDFIVEISGGSPTQSTGRMAFITAETLHRFENPLICSNFCKAVTLKEVHALYNFAYLWNKIYDAGVLFGWEGKTSGIKNLLFESFVTNYEVEKPSEEVMKLFYEKAKPIHAQIQKNLQQNQKLAELRDWLLPMLMNGQVTVSEAKEELGMVAEAGAAYERDKEAIDSLFDKINYDYEVGVVVLLTRQILDRTYGKKYVHKMLSNIQFLEELPVFKDLAFKENGWGMHSKVLDKTIANQKYVYFEDLGNERSVLNFNFKHIKEVSIWMQKDDYSKDFVLKVENMLKIYQKSLINKDMDRIELFNTVLECMAVLETDDFEAVRRKMGSWKMHEEGYATKEDKFTPYETQLMIDFIKDL
ncbi:restriction endonuclease subunit S [Aestuariibaculum sediminum]|uniref:Restriction endonuclease subunit S n=1 Tax=Aestuariibaculum sediminum TaxID=2770637 RepID=A0A8J6Q986_9FLAO|nr:restriction endonuclease subunit S [Aestuariibaculum sediminum]MBD0833748.1 restriction endonuclease subunit S [Aestuariibaculum sediminum]